MKLIKENITFLKAVALLSKDQVKAILAHINKSQILAVVEIARNMLTGIVTIRRDYKRSLKMYKRVIRDLADKRATLNTRRDLITGKADVIALLIKSVLPKLVAIVGHG